MFNQSGNGKNYSRTVALKELERDQEAASERRKAAQRKRKQVLLQAKINDYMESYR